MWMSKTVGVGEMSSIQDRFTDLMTERGWPEQDAAMFAADGDDRSEVRLLLSPTVPEAVTRMLGAGWRPTRIEDLGGFSLLAGHNGVAERLGITLGG